MAFQRHHGLVSVIVPVHNRRRYIVPCLDSLAKQTHPRLEIIVVDDASSDDSRRVIRNWRRTQTRFARHSVQFIALPKNVGYAGAVTVGMIAARGEFIALQDSDDYSAPDRIAKQVAYLRRHTSVGLLGTDYRFVRAGVVLQKAPGWLRFSVQSVRQVYATGGHCISCGTLMLRGRLFDRYGGMTRRIRGAEDYELVARYLNNGVHATNLRQPLYFYRLHAQQRSHAFYGKSARS